MNTNFACNCCAQPLDTDGIAIGIKRKDIGAGFCKVLFPALLPYQDLAIPELTPSVPQNPETGTLYSDIQVNFEDSSFTERETSTGGCFDIVGGYTEYEESITLEETIDEKIKIVDYLRDPENEQQCFDGCGSGTIPKLSGSGNKSTYDETNYSSLVNGGCGSDYNGICGNQCGDPIGNCTGNGTPISLDVTESEETNWSVNGCKDLTSSPFYSSAQGTSTITQQESSNCCFAFVCNAQVQRSPDPNPSTSTQTNSFNGLFFPPVGSDKTSAEPINPTEIEQVINDAKAKIEDVDFYEEETQDGYGWTLFSMGRVENIPFGSTIFSSSYTRNTSPFSESGYANYANIRLGEFEYIIAATKPTTSCYLKIWFILTFLPQEIPDDWETIPTTGGPMPQITEEFDIEYRFGEGDIPNKCWKSEENLISLDAFGNFESEKLIKLFTEPRNVAYPEQAGSIQLRILKYSFVDGYVPDDPYLNESGTEYTQGCRPNGFPAPEVQC